MRVKSLLKVGFLSMLAATAALSASNSFAAGAQRVDIIDSLPAGNQSDSMKAAGDQAVRVDVIENIGSNGAGYPSSSGATRVDVIDSLESRGPVYPSPSGSMDVNVLDSLLTAVSQLNHTKPAGDLAQRADVIDSLPTGAQWDSMKATGDQAVRVDVIEGIGSRGAVYPSTSGAMRVDVIESTRS